MMIIMYIIIKKYMDDIYIETNRDNNNKIRS